MSIFDCPACGTEFNSNDYPDHLSDMGSSNRFTFECDCGARFQCDVDWEPEIYVLKDTLVKPEPQDT